MTRAAAALLALVAAGCTVRVKHEHRFVNGLRCEAKRGLISAEVVCRPEPPRRPRR